MELFKRTGSDDFPSYLKMMISGPPKSGKALANGTPVLTPDGWKPIETLNEGDLVIGSDGRPTEVVGVFPQGVKPMRRVFTNDGGMVLASDTHLWTVLPHSNSIRTVTTDEVAKRIGAGDNRFAYLPVVAPIEFDDDELPVDPYLLGLLLGDGGLTTTTVNFHKLDTQLHQAIAAAVPDATLFWNEAAAALSIADGGKLHAALTELGLDTISLDKHLPERYLWTSVQNRLALLSGLLDTDGDMNGKSTCFYTSSPRLRDGVVALVQSLGGVAVVRTKDAPAYTYRGERLTGAPAFNVSIRLPVDLGCPFRLSRKVTAWSNGAITRPPTRRIVTIEPVQDLEATCIKVANNDGLFVTQDYIVTHNTTLLGTVPNIVVADTEPHANNLQSIAHKNVPYVTIQGSDDLQRLLFVLRDGSFREKAAAQLGMPKIEAVAVDTLDTLQMVMKKERMRATGKDFLRDDWGWIKEEMTSILQAFTALPMHVFFTVHTKTKEIGKGDDVRTIILPGLEGSIAESIAGMVGYSVLSFRKEEIRQDGSKYTKYWLRTEGDETYDYLGTRTAGRLPEVIEPDFSTILKAALDGRPTVQPEPVQLEIETTQAQAPITVTGVTGSAPQAGPTSFVPGQNTSGPAQPNVQVTNPEPATQQPAAQQPAAQQPAAQQAPAQTPSPGDDEPMNAAALMHVHKAYEAAGLTFPEETVTAMKLGQARHLVGMWRAAQQDATQNGSDPKATFREYLDAMGWLAAADQNGNAPEPAKPQPAAPQTLDEAKTIEQVLAWAGDDLQRIQQAYDAETADTNTKPRSSLIETLVRKGAKIPAVVQAEPAPPEPQPQPQTEPQSEPDPEPATQVRDADAVATIEQGLGGQVIAEEISETSVCVECGKTIDDIDIAKLSDARYHKVLCVNDYIAETKKIAIG